MNTEQFEGVCARYALGFPTLVSLLVNSVRWSWWIPIKLWNLNSGKPPQNSSSWCVRSELLNRVKGKNHGLFRRHMGFQCWYNNSPAGYPSVFIVRNHLSMKSRNYNGIMGLDEMAVGSSLVPSVCIRTGSCPVPSCVRHGRRNDVVHHPQPNHIPSIEVVEVSPSYRLNSWDRYIDQSFGGGGIVSKTFYSTDCTPILTLCNWLESSVLYKRSTNNR